MTTLALVVLLHALLLLLLLRLGPMPPPQEERLPPIFVDLVPVSGPPPEATPEPETQIRPTEPVQQAEEPAAATDVTELPPVAPPDSIWSQVVPLSREELAAADRAIRPSPPAAEADASASDSRLASVGQTDDSTGPGTGPNGEALYNARWYREPTHAELNAYLPKGWRQEGWGMVACKTVPGNRVEDCHEIGQTPGSGLAGAVRRAAWQFRILPPRIGGRPMVGGWVRIRIDYRVEKAE